MLNYIKYNFDDIESYIQQLDEKNQTYIRITRQKLTYMLSMDTSIKGDIIALLRDAKARPDSDWERLNKCINLFDVRQVTESSFYRPRQRHVRNGGEELGIEDAGVVSQEEVDAVVDTRAAQYTGAKVNAYARRILDGRASFAAREMAVEGDDDYLMAIFLALNSTDHKSPYLFDPAEHLVRKGRYQIPAFTLKQKEEAPQ